MTLVPLADIVGVCRSVEGGGGAFASGESVHGGPAELCPCLSIPLSAV